MMFYLLQEVLEESPAVFWIDSSIYFTSNNFSAVFRQLDHQKKGVLSFSNSRTSIFEVTHPEMYQYLPMSTVRAKRVSVPESGCILLYRTADVYNHIVRWWLLCALQQQCMAPTTSQLHCNRRNRQTYAGCHRYDQSALNILLANLFPNKDLTCLSTSKVLEVRRRRKRTELKRCWMTLVYYYLIILITDNLIYLIWNLIKTGIRNYNNSIQINPVISSSLFDCVLGWINC